LVQVRRVRERGRGARGGKEREQEGRAHRSRQEEGLAEQDDGRRRTNGGRGTRPSAATVFSRAQHPGPCVGGHIPGQPHRASRAVGRSPPSPRWADGEARPNVYLATSQPAYAPTTPHRYGSSHCRNSSKAPPDLHMVAMITFMDVTPQTRACDAGPKSAPRSPHSTAFLCSISVPVARPGSRVKADPCSQRPAILNADC
jgi:hypothetical protein